MPTTGQAPRQRPGLQQQAPQEAYVSFSSEISPQTTEGLIALMARIANARIPRVHLLLSTMGGSVMHGITLYNTLRGLPLELVTHNVGNVNSIGNAIFLAGDIRYACPHSTFMFHGVGFNVPAGVRIEEKLLRERMDGLLADQRLIAGIIEERTTLETSDVEQLFLEAKTQDAAYAVNAGIVHEIRDVNIPDGHPIEALVFQRQPVVGPQ